MTDWLSTSHGHERFNVTPTAVIQVKRGIGDVIWHLPFVRAVAAVSPGGRVTFLAPPTSGARELLAAEPSVAETIYFEHSGSELRRGINLLRLVALLRPRRFRTLWILDRTTRPALAGLLAGIPERIGLGFGVQRLLLTHPGIARSHFHDLPIECLRVLMGAMNVPLPNTEPDLRAPDGALAEVDTKFGACRRPWIVVGIGGSHSAKDWPDAHWRALLDGFARLSPGTVFLVGGSGNAVRAQSIAARSNNASVVNGCELSLVQVLALLRRADTFVGTDSGPMNLAVASRTPTFTLFGATPVLNYSKLIRPIEPDGGPGPDGMQRISPAQVLERVAAYLADETSS
jgi:heptosyltransferase II